MKTAISSRVILAPLNTIRNILLRPLELPTWNPALLELAGPDEAQAGHVYRLTALAGLRGTFSYSSLSTDRVDMAWEVTGMQEHCVWTMDPEPGGIRVTHEVSRSGPLAVVLHSALAGLPDLRLDRLDQVARAQSGSVPATS